MRTPLLSFFHRIFYFGRGELHFFRLSCVRPGHINWRQSVTKLRSMPCNQQRTIPPMLREHFIQQYARRVMLPQFCSKMQTIVPLEILISEEKRKLVGHIASTTPSRHRPSTSLSRIFLEAYILPPLSSVIHRPSWDSCIVWNNLLFLKGVAYIRGSRNRSFL